MNTFVVTRPQVASVPILVSVPHCGVAFPDEIRGEYDQSLIASPDDTDWFVEKLYDFAPSMGITMIQAVYSRWVIDLNRDPQSKPLYTDGRIITGLCPTTTFLGEPLYRDQRKELTTEETARRLTTYYWPYHEKLQELLTELKSRFGKVLLWDCHSIRQEVNTIYKGKFPDLILGDDEGKSASPAIVDLTYKNLNSRSYSLNHNFPFKGGFITRNYGKPIENQQALQLEMSKINYMDDQEQRYDLVRAEKMRDLLKDTFEKLIEALIVH
jgi:N-formylglutamate deformylase